MTDQEIIERLGGVKAIAEFFNWNVSTVHNWIHRGIPNKVKVDYKEYFLTDNPKPLQKEKAQCATNQ